MGVFFRIPWIHLCTSWKRRLSAISAPSSAVVEKYTLARYSQLIFNKLGPFYKTAFAEEQIKTFHEKKLLNSKTPKVENPKTFLNLNFFKPQHFLKYSAIRAAWKRKIFEANKINFSETCDLYQV